MKIENRMHREGTVELIDRLRTAKEHSRRTMTPASFQQVESQLDIRIALLEKAISDFDAQVSQVKNWGVVTLQASAFAPTEKTERLRIGPSYIRLEHAVSKVIEEPAKPAGSSLYGLICREFRSAMGFCTGSLA